MKSIFLLEDLFYKRLNNFWDVTMVSSGRQEYFVTVVGDRRVLEAVVKISYPFGDTANARLISEKGIDRFTNADIDSLFEDITRIVHHYGGPRYKIVKCQAMFGNRILNYGWHVDEVVKEGDLR